MAIKVMPFDAADYLATAEARAVFLTEALKSNDSAHIANAMGAVARACGIAKIAKIAGVPRKALCETLSVRGNPELATVLKLLDAAGLRLAVRRTKISAPESSRRSTIAKVRID